MAATTIDERRTTMSKIILLDVDGTLVDDDNNLPDSAVRAIRAALNSIWKATTACSPARASRRARSTPSASIPPARARRTLIA
ncbi:hydrolase [Bifidobacterium bifidum]|uniref:hydrolase n=2 Tax=Bifidobacterium bifidum TaxID=1681 RepID=UPI0022E3362A|nr:hydrolase [Bifidobacterium bifidum]